jgi:membrane-associated phospholipid phosphatase
MSDVRWTIVAATLLAAALGTVASGFTLTFPMVGVAVLVLSGALYYYRREPSFALCLTALLQIVLFSTAFALLTYLGARIDRPLVDEQLAAWDAALGFHVADMVAWQSRHPTVGAWLTWAYNSMFLQTAVVVALLGLRGDRRLETFVLRMMLAGIVTLGFFLFMPAEGSFRVHGFSPGAPQIRYLEHFHALRNGTQTVFNFSDVEGLITFPSFHTIWALLLTIACLHLPVIRVVAAVLNAAVLASTLTVGLHYLSDVLAGVVVCAFVCLATREPKDTAAMPSYMCVPPGSFSLTHLFDNANS